MWERAIDVATEAKQQLQLSQHKQSEQLSTCTKAGCGGQRVSSYQWVTRPACFVLFVWQGVTAVPPRQMDVHGTRYYLYGVSSRQTAAGVSAAHFVSWLIAKPLASDAECECWFSDCIGIAGQPAARAKRCVWPPPNLLTHCIKALFYLQQPW